MRIISGILFSLFVSCEALAVDIGSLSNADAVSGLKDALTQGSAAAIGKLGVENGFLGNDKVKIPLPDAFKRVESGLRLLGMQRQADELVTAMNRAAEQAVPEAKPLLSGAVKNMSVQDAKGILTGGDTAATEYFRKTTSDQLTEKFLPIVTKATQQGRARREIQQSRRAGRATGSGRRQAGEDRKLRHAEDARRPVSDDRGAGESDPQGSGRRRHRHGEKGFRHARQVAARTLRARLKSSAAHMRIAGLTLLGVEHIIP